MKIYRNGLILKCNEVIPSQGSQNVPIELIEDDTYIEFTKNIFISYGKNKREILDKKDGKFILPKEAFAESGIIGLVVKMTYDEESVITKKIELLVYDAPVV